MSPGLDTGSAGTSGTRSGHPIPLHLTEPASQARRPRTRSAAGRTQGRPGRRVRWTADLRPNRHREPACCRPAHRPASALRPAPRNHHRNINESQLLGRQHPAIAGDDHPGLINQHRIGPAHSEIEAAIFSICALEWVLAFFPYGTSSATDRRSTRSAGRACIRKAGNNLCVSVAQVRRRKLWTLRCRDLLDAALV